MTALIVSRDEALVSRLVKLVRDEGIEMTEPIDVAGTASAQQAISHIESGRVQAVVIGGSVDDEDRKRLTLAAEGRGIPVIPGALHEADLREYTEEELLPQLRTLGIC